MELFFTFIATLGATVLLYLGYLEYRKAAADRRAELIDDLVEAAQQLPILQGKPGAERFRWVMGRLQKRYPALHMDDTQIQIEAAVYRMKQRSGASVLVLDPPAEAEQGRAIDDEGGAFWLKGRQN